ncbi:MAG: hypothetical protein MUF83_15765 [Acidimicrobiales bacterium]|jgi:hypothetical protein|nr:hypothetical protein [Acidimicrobiales bacterium]
MAAVDTALLGLHLFATAAMVGLIWFVQVVHHPVFTSVGADRFVRYEAEHQRRTAWVVGPFMAVGGVTVLAIAGFLLEEVGTILAVVGLVLLAVIHASTVLAQVPAHRLLSAGYDPTVAARLVCGNWVRTGGWSARGVVAVAMSRAAVPA